MNFQTIVDGMSSMACVISVERLPDGKPGIFRIEAGNSAYINSIEHPVPGMKMLRQKFIPGSEYTDYLTRDLNFEDFCFRAAVEKKCLHSYVHPERMDVWLNMVFLPLETDRDDLSYCIYLMEVNEQADYRNISDISSETASSVLDTCLRLRGTSDFKATMKDVVSGIRELCSAEHCCILVMNEYDRSCYVLGEAFSDDTPLLPMETYVNDEFYDIAESWESTIAGSNCLIAKDEQDMQVVKERNPGWYESLTSAGAHNIVLFPLKSRNQLLGYMWSINFDPGRAPRIKETLEVTTFIVGSELGNYLLLDRLRLLGSKDLLTGVMNRNEMNNYVDSLCHGDDNDIKSVGVIFADLNGLKAVNDFEGHNSGDIMLKNAANILKELFDEKEIFRAGGDEFAVIVTDITQDELDEKIDRIRSECERYGNVILALGGAVESDTRNVRMALSRADEIMSANKLALFRQNSGDTDDSGSPFSDDISVDEKFREISLLREINYDNLTGLPNMTYFFKLAENGRKNMHERGIDSAIVYINLSSMKYYNQRYGFAEGDTLLKELANILSKYFGEENCSRFGQDHFAVYTEAGDLENKLKKVFREAKKMNGGRSLPVRAGIYPDSMGLVEVSLACDRAKVASSVKRDDSESCFDYYDKKMLASELNKHYIIDNIDRAINENWIKAFYQPIIRATGRKICDEEALARWIDPEKGMLSPADFIPILEDTRLIYKVDLHIVDIIIERMKKQRESGLTIVPVSVNLSRTDFEACDIVSEINNRIETAGISKDLITIEITESVVGENFDFMKERIERFQKLGYKVWMDDFGSGYSSLDLLQEMKFDLIKFDMRFMRQFDNNPRSRIVLTELMRMAQSLGIETVCEGVETAEQADFLTEIGCTRLQGYYFCKPVPVEEIWKNLTEKTGKLQYEEPNEASYQSILGAINLYDINSVSGNDTETSGRYFDTMPMAVVEYNGRFMQVIRCNRSYREFVSRFFVVNEDHFTDPAEAQEHGLGYDFVKALERCREEGNRIFLDDKLNEDTTIHIMVKQITDRPDSDASAYVVAVLDITTDSNQVTFANIAQALSSDYEYLYYVDIETDQFVEYSHDSKGHSLSAERHGEDFFAAAQRDIGVVVYEADIEGFREIMTKENVIKTLDEQGVFVHTYRLLKNGMPTFVNMKIVRMDNDDSHIIIGVNNVDSQMRAQETIERLKEEQITYSRISALMGNFIAIYTVDPETGAYMQYSAMDVFSQLGTSRAGIDFFADSEEEIGSIIHPDDLGYFLSVFSREKMLARVKTGRVYKINYRLMINGSPVPVSLRASLVQEHDGPQLIVGVNRQSDAPDM